MFDAVLRGYQQEDQEDQDHISEPAKKKELLSFFFQILQMTRPDYKHNERVKVNVCCLDLIWPEVAGS